MHVSSTVDCCNSQKDKRNTSRFPYSLPFLFVPGLNSFPPPRSGVRPGRDLVQDGTRIDKGCDIVILNVVLIS